MGDATVGGLCGFRIRGEAKVSTQTALTFVTTGVLLRQLEQDPSLSSLTHVVVDEVHERSVDVELLLLALRRLLHAASCGGRIPRIILMSATVDVTEFADYFHGTSSCGPKSEIGLCDVPGRAFPVEELFLEEAVCHSGYVCSSGSEFGRQKSLPTNPTITSRLAAATAAAAAATALAAAQAATVS